MERENLAQTMNLYSSHSFVNQFEKMDRSKSNTSGGSNHKDIICGQPFDPVDVLEEIARIRHIPVDAVKSKQDDAHELLCQILSELHDEICSILYKSSSPKNGKSNSEFHLHENMSSY